MKAIILAAGLGTRLRPITNTTPKCMVMVTGKPLLEWWFRLLSEHGITEFLINTHHLPEKVEEFVGSTAKKYGLLPTIAFEPELLGSAGTLLKNRAYYQDEEAFFVVYADTLTNLNLTKLLEFHKSRNADLSIALFRMSHPETRGIVELDSDGKILSFIEKPPKPKSDLANGGTYVMTDKVIAEALRGTPNLFDIGKDILQKNRSIAYGLEFDSYLRDIGTVESLEAAQSEWMNMQSGK